MCGTNNFRKTVLSSKKTSIHLRASELNKSCMTNNVLGSEVDAASPNSYDVLLPNAFLSLSQKNVAPLENLHIVETIHEEKTNES